MLSKIVHDKMIVKPFHLAWPFVTQQMVKSFYGNSSLTIFLICLTVQSTLYHFWLVQLFMFIFFLLSFIVSDNDCNGVPAFPGFPPLFSVPQDVPFLYISIASSISFACNLIGLLLKWYKLRSQKCQNWSGSAPVSEVYPHSVKYLFLWARGFCVSHPIILTVGRLLECYCPHVSFYSFLSIKCMFLCILSEMQLFRATKAWFIWSLYTWLPTLSITIVLKPSAEKCMNFFVITLHIVRPLG